MLNDAAVEHVAVHHSVEQHDGAFQLVGSGRLELAQDKGGVMAKHFFKVFDVLLIYIAQHAHILHIFLI